MVQFKDENGNWVKAAEDYAYSWGQAGMVVPFAGVANKVPPHWVLCDGSEYDCSSYPNLFAVIGYSYGGSGSKFKVPDYRECALVGSGENGTDTIAAHDVYDVGEFKDDQLQDHTHNYTGMHSAGGQGGSYGRYTNTADGTITSGRHGLVTRGKRKGVSYIIHV